MVRLIINVSKTKRRRNFSRRRNKKELTNRALDSPFYIVKKRMNPVNKKH